jgi:hypothetical protein
MPKIKHILAVATVFSFLFSTISSLASSSPNSPSGANSVSQTSQTSSSSVSISSQQVKLADMPNGKKQLKKPLLLDYTDPKFETEINKSQENAILTALKKWKGELPVNNTFTITSWADLKTDTSDNMKQSKKKDKKTPNAVVVYMWASTPNVQWDNNKPFDPEDYESGDPRFIRTEFNVLLKQDMKNNWKASIERDAEIKTESESITESPEDQKVYQDLFGTNKADNLLTATSDILVDSISSISSTSSSLTSISTVITSSPVVSSIISNNSSTISNSSQTQSNSSTSSKKVGFLESFLNFGSVKASAGEYDYSWPWKAGDTWSVNTGYGWHECNPGGSYNYSEGVNVSGCAFDVSPNGNTSNTVLAPKTATVQRACKDSLHGFLKFDNMSILHLDAGSMTALNNVTITKGQTIGSVYNSPVNSRCGSSTGPHLHIKFAVNNMVVDGTTVVHNGPLPSTLTSQNSSNTNPYNGFIKANSNNQLVFDIVGANSNDQAPVKLFQGSYSNTAGSVNQRWGYDSNTKEIKGMNNKCLDAGNVSDSNNRWLRMNFCTGSNNQKWSLDSSSRVHSLANTNQCIDAYGGSINSGTTLGVWDCHGYDNQKWNVADLGMQANSSTPTYLLNRYGYNQCIASNNPSNNSSVYTTSCNSADQDQLWEAIPSNTGGTMYRRKGTNKCIDRYQASQGANTYMWDCDLNASNHAWNFNGVNRLINQTANSGMCLATLYTTNGTSLQTYGCNSGDSRFYWNLIQQ